MRVHGVLGTVRLATEKLCQGVTAQFAQRPSSQSDSFDETWNVQTAGTVDLSDLQVVDRRNLVLGVRYEPTAPETFRQIISAYPLPYEECTFIDCGSGKGRVLLLASEWPFRRIVGVDFAMDLTEVARANILAYKSPTRKCHHVEAVCMDATEFPFPEEPTVLYIYNPFAGPVMRKLVNRVESSLNVHPRRFFVLYRNPKFAALWDSSEHFKRVCSSESFIIYQSVRLT
jgi:methyltransferase family protein